MNYPLPRIGTFDDLPADHYHTCLYCGATVPCDALDCDATDDTCPCGRD